MNKIKELAVNYKNILLLLAVLVLGLIFWVYVIPYFMTNDKKEHLENVSGSSLPNIVNQDVYVKCNIEELDTNKNKITNTYYLSVSEKKNCTNLANVAENECLNNIPILIKQPTDFSLFEFKKHPSNNMYTIRSRAVQIHSPNLTQNLNVYRNKNLLCFDNDKGNDIIYFEVVEVVTGYLLKFKKQIKDQPGQYQYYYVGLCSELDPTCNIGPDKYKRLCLYIDQAKATVFQFDVQPKKQLPGEEEHFSSLGSINSLDSIYSINSANSFDSHETLMSLPGAGNIEDANLEDFKPWTEDH